MDDIAAVLSQKIYENLDVNQEFGDEFGFTEDRFKVIGTTASEYR